MRNFNREKEQLISDLKLVIAEHPEEKILVEIHRILLDLNAAKQLVNLPGAIDNAGFADFQKAILANPKNKSSEEILKLLSRYGQKKYPGVLSRMIVDTLDYKFQIGERIIEFERYFSDPTNSLISTDLKKLAKYLLKKNRRITYWGKAWSRNKADWIYFDTVLDVEKLRAKFNFEEHITVHQNSDPKSGLEKGFIDQKTGEVIIGRLHKTTRKPGVP